MNSSSARVVIPDVRVAFVVLAEPKEFKKGDGKPRYSVTAILPNGSGKDKLVLDAMHVAAANKWGEAKAAAAVKSLMQSGRTCLVSGAIKADKYEGFDDCMIVSAYSPAPKPPRLYDAEKNPLPLDSTMIYSGCYADVLVDCYADDRYGNRINAGLLAVRFRRAGDYMGGARPASADEFETLAGEETIEPDFV
ncbi:hypothetical protein RF55_2324 [Lasius niger]|uniref:Uncharacterized protein n=1 Tax=Lasius niger TaxID=67767 RepID=A0A0J7L3X3_LASNI|nr:hypothetical protein RF55_2324 [Lasius niger]